LTNPTTPTTKMIGRHQIRYEPETGFICLRSRGIVDAQHVEQMLAVVEAYAGDEPAFVLADDREVAGLTKDARALLAKRVGRESYVATFGGSFAFRAIANVIVRGLQLLADGFHFSSEPDERTARMAHRKTSRIPRSNE